MIKLVPFYFPQLHPIPENDEWWGKGFTDWVNVKKAAPQFKGHYQPRVPLGGRYYDQSQKDVIRWQVDLAKAYGIYGFCHYHYWFDGKQLLQTPTNILMDSKELNIRFCLAWANETWSRRWDGLDHFILIKQSYTCTKEAWKAHFDYLFRAWSDERAIRIDDKPVFLIYRTHTIPELKNMLDYWKELAVKRGLKGVYFIALKQYEFPAPQVLKYFDAVVYFQPFEAIFSPNFAQFGLAQNKYIQKARALPEKFLDILRFFKYHMIRDMTFYDFDMTWEHILKDEKEGDLPTLAGAFMDWDNTARYGKRATVFNGASPERFEYWFRQLVEIVSKKPISEQFIFINAWNEWSECSYLEPDERFGYQYLEAVKRCLA